jgi:AraC-like DNA-binding protein
MAELFTNPSQRYLRVRRGPVVFGNVLYQPKGICGPRVQRDYQLVVIHTGSLQLHLDNEIIVVQEDHAVLLGPGHREHFLFAADTQTYHSWCAVEPKFVPLALRRKLQHFRGPVPFLGRMAMLLELGKNASVSATDRDDELENGCYLYLALALMADVAMAARKGRVVENYAEAVLSRMEQFIARQYAKPLVLADIATASGVSPQHLLKLCRLNGKPTPTQRLYKKRLESAADLLLNTGSPIGEIASRCGFVNIYHFSRKFKEAYRRSPLIWRKALWKAKEQR